MAMKIDKPERKEGVSRREILGGGVAMSTLATASLGSAAIGGAAGVMVAPRRAYAATDASDEANVPPGKLDALMADKPALQKLMLHHIINAPVPASKIKGSRGPVPSGAGDPIALDGSGEPLKADNANIIQSDVAASNGTIHVVDQVLMAGSVPATLPEAATEATPEPAAPTAKAAPKKN